MPSRSSSMRACVSSGGFEQNQHRNRPLRNRLHNLPWALRGFRTPTSRFPLPQRGKPSRFRPRNEHRPNRIAHPKPEAPAGRKIRRSHWASHRRWISDPQRSTPARSSHPCSVPDRTACSSRRFHRVWGHVHGPSHRRDDSHSSASEGNPRRAYDRYGRMQRHGASSGTLSSR